MPIVQVLLISVLGAFMATEYLNLLSADTRKSLNKIVFVVFTPSLMFASLAKTVTLEDIISWWFMPVNIGLTFVFGGILGWLVVKIMKPQPHLEGLIMATCSAGNMGNLLLIVVPEICTEEGSPFGDHVICGNRGLSYASFSMAVGGFYIWTYTYQLIRNSSMKYKEMKANEEDVFRVPNKEFDGDEKTNLLDEESKEYVAVIVSSSVKSGKEESENNVEKENFSIKSKIFGIFHMISEELTAPPTLGSILGFLFGATPWLKKLVIGDNAPLRVIQDSVQLLGDGTIPCITLILGGNLTQGMRQARVKPTIIIALLCVRFLILPFIGIGVVKAATYFGILPSDPLFHFVLMIQFAVPPAMNIGTMTQLFDVAQAECSVLLLWTYLVAAFALTIWSTIFMWILF